MKKTKWVLLAAIFFAVFTNKSYSQEQTLPEVTVFARNYKYLRDVNSKDAAQPVKLLERKVASYDVKSSEFYQDDYDNYFITFYLPSGYILAVYDQNGKLLRTAERFKNIALPGAVKDAIAKRYPNWAISKDIYRVKYDEDTDSKMDYKLVLMNGDKRLRIKINDKGEFTD
ncbi:MAG TPA: hypothetical protein VHB48_17855 [Chitinophagaceae bacterium]|jgi:hypothetical protein|nr:hypothetical protein [Chitinophagaceae bacterium]